MSWQFPWENVSGQPRLSLPGLCPALFPAQDAAFMFNYLLWDGDDVQP